MRNAFRLSLPFNPNNLFTPFRVPGLLPRLYPGLEWKIPVRQNTVFLTFDDGPHPVITPWVIDQLNIYGAKATFFCVGENAAKYPGTIAALLKNGHQVGNHTHNHVKGWNLSNAEYVRNVKTAAPLTSAVLFRPPYGRIRRGQINLLKAQGYRIIMWSLLSCDYLPGLNRQKSLDALLANTRPGSVIVFHDSEKAQANLKWLLPRYLEAVSLKGFNFQTL